MSSKDDIEIDYKVLLSSVVRKRKTEPKKLSHLLGNSLRLEMNVIENLKVNLYPKEQLKPVQSKLDDELQKLENLNKILADNTLNVSKVAYDMAELIQVQGSKYEYDEDFPS